MKKFLIIILLACVVSTASAQTSYDPTNPLYQYDGYVYFTDTGIINSVDGCNHNPSDSGTTPVFQLVARTTVSQTLIVDISASNGAIAYHLQQDLDTSGLHSLLGWYPMALPAWSLPAHTTITVTIDTHERPANASNLLTTSSFTYNCTTLGLSGPVPLIEANAPEMVPTLPSITQPTPASIGIPVPTPYDFGSATMVPFMPQVTSVIGDMASSGVSLFAGIVSIGNVDTLLVTILIVIVVGGVLAVIRFMNNV